MTMEAEVGGARLGGLARSLARSLRRGKEKRGLSRKGIRRPRASAKEARQGFFAAPTPSPRWLVSRGRGGEGRTLLWEGKKMPLEAGERKGKMRKGRPFSKAQSPR